MVELTDREKQIVLIKYIVHGNSPYAEAPIKQRVSMLQAALKLSGIDYDESEMLDIGEAILKVQENVNKSAEGFLEVNASIVEMALARMGKGNERFKFKG